MYIMTARMRPAPGCARARDCSEGALPVSDRERDVTLTARVRQSGPYRNVSVEYHTNPRLN